MEMGSLSEEPGLSKEDLRVLYDVLLDSAVFQASWDAFELLHRAATARSDLRQVDVAARLGVSRGLVS